MEEKMKDKISPPIFKAVEGGVEMRFENDDSKLCFFMGLLRATPNIQGVRCVSKGCIHNLNESKCCSMGKQGSIVEIGAGGICLKFKSKGGDDSGE